MEFILSEDHGSFVSVALNRPEKRNAFHPIMIQEITDFFVNLKANSKWSYVLLKGNGQSFCSGADLSWMQSMVDYTYEENIEDSIKLHKMFEAIKLCPIPVVGFVHGYVMGGAIGLAACCDIVVCDENTQFCFSEVKLGLAPAVICPFVLAKMKKSSATRFMISGEVFNAQEALESGLCQVLGSSSECESYLVSLGEQLSQNGKEAMVKIKALIQKIVSPSFAGVMSETTTVIAGMRVGTEGQKRLKSFLQGKSK